MNFAFHPEAEEEFNEAIEYYEEIGPGIGYDFALEVYSTKGVSNSLALHRQIVLRRD